MNHRSVWGILGVAAVLAMVTPVQAASYTGWLSVGDGGLVATGVWDDDATTLRWVVDDVTTPGRWHYSYTLAVGGQQGAGISHVIFETSEGFGFGNLFDATTDPPGWVSAAEDGTEIKTHEPGGGNPGMPANVYGIKFNAAAEADATTLTLSFDSDRVPVWGDLYAKGGQGTLWNAGFATADPTDPPANGTIAYHALVPDTVTATIPAPGALVLGSFGVAFVGWLRTRRRLL